MFMHEKVVSLVQISKIWSIAHPAPIHLPFLQQELLFPVFLDPSKPQSPQDHSANFSLPTCLQPVQSCLNDFLDTTESSKVHPDPSNCLSKTSRHQRPPFSFQLPPFSDISFPLSGKYMSPHPNPYGWNISIFTEKQKASKNIELSKKKNHSCLPWIWLIETFGWSYPASSRPPHPPPLLNASAILSLFSTLNITYLNPDFTPTIYCNLNWKCNVLFKPRLIPQSRPAIDPWRSQ